jgi:hypothetical protein
MKFGFELEMGSGGLSQGRLAAEVLRREGLVLAERRCGAHCQCPHCRYSRKEGLMAYQSDSGVAVEFVSRILTTNSTRDRAEVRKLEAVYPEMLSAMGWQPDGRFGAGNHCHVGWPVRDYQTKARVTSALHGMFAAEVELWQRVADGGCGQHRAYNGTAGIRHRNYYGESTTGQWEGNWLSDRGHGTLEFRLWNTPVDAKRLMVHPAISTALMRWALSVVEEHSHLRVFDTANSTFEWVQNRAVPERKRVVGLIGDIWRDKPSARLAAELLAA